MAGWPLWPLMKRDLVVACRRVSYDQEIEDWAKVWVEGYDEKQATIPRHVLAPSRQHEIHDNEAMAVDFVKIDIMISTYQAV